MTLFTIEAEMYLGTDSREELYLIGPFASVEAREEALARLRGLAAQHGNVIFSIDHRPMSVADHVVDLSPETGQPDRLDRIECFHDLYEAFGFDF